MRLEFSSNDSGVSLVENEYTENAVSENSSDELSAMLRNGIKAAQSGNRAEARHLLLRVTENDPKNENAWLWLASISEYPEELLVYLNNVLDINPENERALEWAKATKSLLAKTFVRRGIDANKEDRKNFARQCFMQAVVYDNHNEMAWLWLASIADSDKEKNEHMRRVLEINPQNTTALEALNLNENEPAQSFLSKAGEAAVFGDFESAKSFLEKFLEQEPETESAWALKSHLTNSLKEKAECFEKILEFNPESEFGKVNLQFLRTLSETAEPVSFEPEPEASFEPEPEVNLEIEESEAAENYDFGYSADESDSAAEIQEEAFSSDSPTQKLFFEPEYKLEVEKAFETSQTEAESEEPVEEFAYEEVSVKENFYDFGSASVESENLLFEAESEYGEEYKFEEPENSYSEYSGENQAEEFSAEMPYENQAVYENNYSVGAEASNEAYEIDANEVVAEDESDRKDFSQNSDESGQQFEEEAESTLETAERQAEEDVQANAAVACPFCREEMETQAVVCGLCGSMLTFSDLEMLLAHQEVDFEIVRKAIEEMEAEENDRALESGELVKLGLGHINLKNYRKGLDYLQKAARLDPNNVVLDSHVNSLAIRLSEIEEKASVHNSLPKDRTIMVVDDSATVRKLISGKLEKCGHIVITAVDGMDAMEKLEDVTPDLILLDINMPRMDGYQVCKLIRNNESTKEIPVVMISGKDGFFDKVRGRMAGTTSYITKPFGPETLMKMLETYLV